ncbi:MAG: succinate dehydrogenase, cytochrome b556 subunit [Thermoplasmata archaeon]
MLRQRGFGHYARRTAKASKETGTFAHVVHRTTGILLVVYLMMHVFIVTQASLNGQGYEDILNTFKSPLFTMAELIVVLGVLVHGLNGIRLTLFDLGIGLKHQKMMFWAFMIIAAAVWLAGLVLIWPTIGGG